MHTFLLKSATIGLLLALLSPLSALADSQTLKQVLQSIRTSQNISETESIDCTKVTTEEFETLGDAVMGVMHPDTAQHEVMDSMMGGEGSESLTSMHAMMGAQYLKCNNVSMGNGMMGMMGGFGSGTGMMGSFSKSGMMNGYWPIFPIFWILLLIAVVAGIYYISKKKNTEFSSPLSVTKFGWRLTAILEILYLICVIFLLIFWGTMGSFSTSMMSTSMMSTAFWPLGILAGAFDIFIVSWIASAIFVWIFNTSFSSNKK